jgi:uncharacterized protein YfaT (DUF1175 family)
MEEQRMNKLKEVFKKAFAQEPEEVFPAGGFLYTLKNYCSGNLIVRFKAQEADKYKRGNWRLDVGYEDEEGLLYTFEKYELFNGKAYKLTIEIFIEIEEVVQCYSLK